MLSHVAPHLAAAAPRGRAGAPDRADLAHEAETRLHGHLAHQGRHDLRALERGVRQADHPGPARRGRGDGHHRGCRRLRGYWTRGYPTNPHLQADSPAPWGGEGTAADERSQRWALIEK